MVEAFQEKKIEETPLISTTPVTAFKPQMVAGLRLKVVQLKIKGTLLKVIIKYFMIVPVNP